MGVGRRGWLSRTVGIQSPVPISIRKFGRVGPTSRDSLRLCGATLTLAHTRSIMGEKRMSDGEEKHPKRARTGVAPSNDTPPGAQAPRSSVAPSTAPATANETRNPKKRQLEQPHDAPVDPKQPRAPFRKQDRKKLPRLPHSTATRPAIALRATHTEPSQMPP